MNSVSPAQGFGATTITITGSSLAGVTQVLVGGQTCSNLSIVSATQIRCDVAAADPGSADIVLSDGSGNQTTVTSGFIFDPTLVGPFANYDLPAVKRLPSKTIGDAETLLNWMQYPINRPFSANTIVIYNSSTPYFNSASAAFLRADTILPLEGSRIGTASTVLAPGGASGGGTGGGDTTGQVNAGNGGASGEPGQNLANGTRDVGWLSATDYSAGYTFGTGGNGGTGGTTAGAGGSGGNGTNAAGGGGGGGGGDIGAPSVQDGGLGGGGGGLLVIVAREILNGASVSFNSNGENGSGDVGAINSAGGGGGGGGVVWIALWTYDGSLNGQVTANGGTGGSGFGTASTAGTAGTVRIYQINQDGSLTLRNLTDTW